MVITVTVERPEITLARQREADIRRCVDEMMRLIADIPTPKRTTAPPAYLTSTTTAVLRSVHDEDKVAVAVAVDEAVRWLRSERYYGTAVTPASAFAACGYLATAYQVAQLLLHSDVKQHGLSGVVSVYLPYEHRGKILISDARSLATSLVTRSPGCGFRMRYDVQRRVYEEAYLGQAEHVRVWVRAGLVNAVESKHDSQKRYYNHFYARPREPQWQNNEIKCADARVKDTWAKIQIDDAKFQVFCYTESRTNYPHKPDDWHMSQMRSLFPDGFITQFGAGGRRHVGVVARRVTAAAPKRKGRQSKRAQTAETIRDLLSAPDTGTTASALARMSGAMKPNTKPKRKRAAK